MSENQFLAFRAADRPLDDQQFEFAEQQSSRADLSRWEMSVEYHYSEFGGDVDEKPPQTYWQICKKPLAAQRAKQSHANTQRTSSKSTQR